MVVIDASVIFKWFATEKEQDLEKALKFLNNHLHKKETIIVPDLILYELANAWTTKTKIDVASIKTYLEDLKDLQLDIRPVTFELIEKAVVFSKKYQVSVYDAASGGLRVHRTGFRR